MTSADGLRADNPLMKPQSSSHDPFYVVKDELTSKIDNIAVKFNLFQKLYETTNTATSSEFKDCRKVLGKELKSAEKLLRDLTMTVDFVVNDREQFGHIDDHELEERKCYISTSRQKLNEIKAFYQGESVKRKMIADERKELESKPMSNLGATNSDMMENTHFIQDQQAQAQMIIKEQDEGLEELSMGVDRLNDMAININDEIKVQNRLLNDLETDLDDTTERMNVVMGKLGKLLKTKDTCQIMTVVILVLVLLVLVALVVFT